MLISNESNLFVIRALSTFLGVRSPQHSDQRDLSVHRTCHQIPQNGLKGRKTKERHKKTHNIYIFDQYTSSHGSVSMSATFKSLFIACHVKQGRLNWGDFEIPYTSSISEYDNKTTKLNTCSLKKYVYEINYYCKNRALRVNYRSSIMKLTK